jgi:hypothetical protein
MFAENKFDKSSVTDIQIILTEPSIEKGMACRKSVFFPHIWHIFKPKLGATISHK